jgi:precorrin-6A/cobalt-precorrin-6A reductase
MILVVGGTAETAYLCEELIKRGFRVLLTMATNLEIHIDPGLNITRRSGPLDEEGFTKLIEERGITAIIDISHPYAVDVKENIRKAAECTQTPYFPWVRPESEIMGRGVIRANDHESAAMEAFSIGGPVLTAIGVRNLQPYIRISQETKLPLFCRILPFEDSVRACAEAGLERENLILAKGPFSVEENMRTIRDCHASALVTKDGGEAGGTREKIIAANNTGCAAIVVKRPETAENYTSGGLDSFLAEVVRLLEAGPWAI